MCLFELYFIRIVFQLNLNFPGSIGTIPHFSLFRTERFMNLNERFSENPSSFIRTLQTLTGGL